MIECRICGGDCSKSFLLIGTMYGTKGEFSYSICDKCGCLQIDRIPTNMSEYYDKDSYYSLNMNKRSLKNILLFKQLKNQIGIKNFWGALVQMLYPVNYGYLKYTNLESYILDVGCGDGEMLRWLNDLGYSRLDGIDPFAKPFKGSYNIISTDIRNYKTDIRYDMIMFIHSLEHLDNQHDVLRAVVKLLAPGGYVVVTIPNFSQYYWDKYNKYLYTLDPPRHFYIHTKESLCGLMNENRMELVSYQTEFDPAIPIMAKNVRNGHTEKNTGTSFVSGAISSLLSIPLRKKLKKENDGAIATYVFRMVDGQ